MRRITVKDNQSLFDISIQEYGTVEGIVAIALANEISITDELIVIIDLKIPEYGNANKKVLNYYKENNITPATAQLSDAIEMLVADALIDNNITPPLPGFNSVFSDEFY